MATTPEPLVEGLTPLEGWRLVAPLEDDWLDDADEDEPVELAPTDDDWPFVDAVPGMVAALTAANTPTAARDPAPVHKVRRLRSRMAASRASIRVVCMSGQSVQRGWIGNGNGLGVR